MLGGGHFFLLLSSKFSLFLPGLSLCLSSNISPDHLLAIFLTFVNILYVYQCIVYICGQVHCVAPVEVRGQLCAVPSFWMWTLRIKLGVKLLGKCPYLLTHLTDPHFLLCLASLPFYLFTVFCLYTFRHSLQGLGESLSLSDTSLIFQTLFSKWYGFNNLIFQVYSTLII